MCPAERNASASRECSLQFEFPLWKGGDWTLGHLKSSAGDNSVSFARDNSVCSAWHLGVCSATCCHGWFVIKGALFSWEILMITLHSSCFFRNRTPRAVTSRVTFWACAPRVLPLLSPLQLPLRWLLWYLPKALGKLRTFELAVASAAMLY